MNNTSLHQLITGNLFETQQESLNGHFATHGIDYLHKYTIGAENPYLQVWLNHGNIPAAVTIYEDGRMDFVYFENGRNHTQRFKNCTAADFSAMIAYASHYLQNNNFEYGKDWYARLESTDK
jgi:hypothetical protein